MNWNLTFLVISAVWTFTLGTDTREGKELYHRHRSDELNIDHIISLWNRSVTEESLTPKVTPVTERTTTFVRSTIKYEPNEIKYKEKVSDNFSSRFSYCLKTKYAAKDYPDQKTVIRCLKAELITKLHELLESPTKNFKLFNGYLEFEKLDEKTEQEQTVTTTPKNAERSNVTITKKYSSRVSSKKPLDISSDPFVEVPLKQPITSHNHANDYYENYKKMLRELVARKNGADLSRRKREDVENTLTLEKSAKLFESGRKLVSEITNNLENDKEQVETLTRTILDPDLVSTINNFTKSYSLRLNFYPGIAARMTRNENSGVTFDLELDDINEVEDVTSIASDEKPGRGSKKKKGTKKISKKTLKKLFPYLLIPFLIQAALLPIVLKFLLFVAIKALIAGKLALILVAFNVIRNASLKSDEDEYIERTAYEHYGYGGGEEYGAWINRRQFTVPESEEEGRKTHNPDDLAYGSKDEESEKS